MAFNLSKLLNRDPDGYIETEIGRLAIFDLSPSGRQELEKASNKGLTGEDFTRLLARYTCFPLDKLRDSKYKPPQIVLTDHQISALSRKSLEALAEVLLEECFEPSTLEKAPGSDDLLEKLMNCYKLRWLDSDQAIANALKRSARGDNRLESINSQIRALPPILANLRPPHSISDSTLVDIKEVLLQMNNFAESSNKEASREARNTGRLALLTLILTLISLAGNPPVSRLICIIYAQTNILRVHALTQAIHASCGFNNLHDSSLLHKMHRQPSGHNYNKGLLKNPDPLRCS